ncbi:MAG TPA: nucleotide disphospho-sugar-binding domain-containing protein [Hyphomicrobiaceae bacterium]|nr:nucleotide disphospho-sugar-binding domain-containing protein [Hyphomicrobiaceae bacterium]
MLQPAAGSHGDILPFVALGREFAARGHEVILYANPFFRRYATDAAIAFVPISTVEAYRTLFRETVESHPGKAFKRGAMEFAAICPVYYQAMKADVIAGETITVGGSLLFAPRLLRDTDGIPCATVHLAPSVFRSNARPARLVPNWIGCHTPTPVKRLAWWMLDTFFYDPNFTAPLNSLRADLGLPRVERIFRSWIHDADCVIGMFPDWFAEPQDDWPSHAFLAGFPLHDDGEQVLLPQYLREFIEAGPPPVGFSAGTATATAHGFFQASIKACQAAGLRAILLSGFPEQIPALLPKGVIHVDYAPFSALLPRLAAFVHHGGIGSTSQALRAGVPQLIRPVAYDQFDNASRAVHLGVAKEVLPPEYERAVAGALKELISDDSLRQRCRQVAMRLANSNSVTAACNAILGRL